ncbi:MAG: hypothetical protein ACLGHQ_10520 [Acidimicrobiia bacterium]
MVAGTSPDRLGLGEGASSPDLQLFRSADGRSWEPWGEPWGNNGAVASTDDVILRTSEPGLLEWSADGVEWTTATFPDGPVDGAYFDMFGGAVQDGDIAYLRGFVADAFAVLGDTAVIPSATRLGNTLVVPLVEPTKALTIWTAAIETLEWTEQTSTRLEYIDNTGSPGMAAITASEDSVVVFTEDRMVDGQTAITVGNLQPASG